MEKKLYDEMVHNVQDLSKSMDLASKNLFVFGHCNASLELIDLLDSLGIRTRAILDNSENKQGISYKGAIVLYPNEILRIVDKETAKDSVVLIASRFYASMVRQLKELGYRGCVRKVIDYNSYAEYSLAGDTIARMWDRKQHGKELLDALSDKFNGCFKVFCPFNALGDIYFMCSYWKSYAAKRSISEVVFCVTGKALADVIHMFEDYSVEIFGQKELDAMIQAVIFENRQDCFIAHQDRPYVVSLQKALYIKKIPLEQIYCCGVYGLPVDTKPSIPRDDLPVYDGMSDIPQGKSVIFSPYAKSVVAINDSVWKKAVNYYRKCGYKCFTNVVGDEKPLDGTKEISTSIAQMRSVVERAGIFIGIRSGMCDILREARAKKIALYPDYNYSDTRWKAIEMYYIDNFEYNLLATEDIEWEKL